MLFLENKAQMKKKQLLNDVFHVKTSQSAKISLILQKRKISQKSHICLFGTKSFIYYD